MNRAKMSMCLIVKNEPLLEKCILSFRAYIDELVIVDTGSTDPETIRVSKKYADIYEIYTECNDPETGLIEDFSMARKRSFDLATNNICGWLDSDDIIVGAENFIKLVDELSKTVEEPNKATAFMFPYEYSYNELGQCTCLHYRERLFSNKNKFHWVNPVHEVKIPNDGIINNFIVDESIIYKHQRQFNNKSIESGRNLRILKKYLEKVGDTDARQLYYIGLEYCNNGFIKEAIDNLIKYINISGWADERMMACLKLVEIYQSMADYESGLKWAFKAIEICETWGEGYFALGRMFYFIAQKGGPEEFRNWQKCVYFSKIGLNLPPTKTLLFINPLDREYDIHRYLNVALQKIGDVQGALESVNLGLKSKPDDQMLLSNKKLFEIGLARYQVFEGINKLEQLKEIDINIKTKLLALINKEVTVESITSKQEVDEEAKKILSSTICDIISKKEISFNKKDESKLDIIFFAGDGVENWTPETVKITGIGGSELMMLELAKRLVALGHSVRIYNSCGVSGIFDGVQYNLTSDFKNLECDVLIISRRTDILADQYNINAKLKLLWIHDIFALNATNELLLKADRILALSDWHKQNLINYHNLHPEHIITTRNGINLDRFDSRNKKRNKFKCVNSSSPDRSWPILLDIWPRIKAQVPQAELHLYYGFKNWEYSAKFDQAQLDLINRLKKQIADMSAMDVIYHDRINQQELADEFLEAGCWLYPTWFSETSCISAMEAQAAGIRIITSNIAALKETVGERGALLDGAWTSKDYQDKFVKNAVAALLYEDNSDRKLLQQCARENFCLDILANEWEKMFFNLLEIKKTNPIIPYFPTKLYR